jgi:hypothetical protein
MQLVGEVFDGTRDQQVHEECHRGGHDRYLQAEDPDGVAGVGRGLRFDLHVRDVQGDLPHRQPLVERRVDSHRARFDARLPAARVRAERGRVQQLAAAHDAHPGDDAVFHEAIGDFLGERGVVQEAGDAHGALDRRGQLADARQQPVVLGRADAPRRHDRERQAHDHGQQQDRQAGARNDAARDERRKAAGHHARRFRAGFQAPPSRAH